MQHGGGAFLTSYRLRAAIVGLFLTICVVQSGRGDDRSPIPGLNVIHRILQGGHVSGSLAYSGCDFDKRVPPDLPPFGVLDESGLPKEILTKLLSADPLMQVTQEEGGMIRMMETNVATDFLRLKIHHLSFYPSDPSASEPVYGPRMALLAILDAPEIVAYRKAHAIGGWAAPDMAIMMPGDCCGGARIVHGELEDVTVSQRWIMCCRHFRGFGSMRTV